jgi:hypothetical protein
MKFRKRLEYMLQNFNLKAALSLSDEIHKAESNGYEVWKTEDRLWEKLTDKILSACAK